MNNRIVTQNKTILVTCLLLTAILFTGCTSIGPLEPEDAAPPEPLDISHIPNAVPRSEPLSQYGNPSSYVVFGKRYYTLRSSKGYRERGIASWYGTKFQGKRTSSGEPYDLYGMTAAHRSLPLPTYVEVTSLKNGRSVIVKVNDRGPFKHGRIIDLSYAAAVKLGILGYGTGLVEVQAIDTSEPALSPGLRQKLKPAGPLRVYLQVGAFRERKYAERLRSTLEIYPLGEVRIVEPGGRSTFYKVQVGPLKDPGEINRVTRKLKALGITDSHILKQ